jgi:hydroxyacyl-ACP dehydratase HTD2-like protein with hotdog domain
VISVEELESLVGHRFPDGQYLIGDERNTALAGAVHTGAAGVPFPPGVAHPVFAHLATHCGMGIGLEDFFALADADLEDGVVFGEGKLTYAGTIRTDQTYTVRSVIDRIERKRGKRTGVFDAVTVVLELVDPSGTTVVTSDETYVFPRRDGS